MILKSLLRKKIKCPNCRSKSIKVVAGNSYGDRMYQCGTCHKTFIINKKKS